MAQFGDLGGTSMYVGIEIEYAPQAPFNQNHSHPQYIAAVYAAAAIVTRLNNGSYQGPIPHTRARRGPRCDRPVATISTAMHFSCFSCTDRAVHLLPEGDGSWDLIHACMLVSTSAR